uniref:Uncharacterized protein n=1 Tax=Glossina palpalis gambiensis TaxID=67801 RepID=A0A1B0BTZ0_9MUSC
MHMYCQELLEMEGGSMNILNDDVRRNLIRVPGTANISKMLFERKISIKIAFYTCYRDDLTECLQWVYPKIDSMHCLMLSAVSSSYAISKHLLNVTIIQHMEYNFKLSQQRWTLKRHREPPLKPRPPGTFINILKIKCKQL